VDGRAAVEVDDLELVLERRPAHELAAGPAAGVERQRVDWPPRPLDRPRERLHALTVGQIGPHGLDCGTEPAQLLRGGVELRVLGGDEQVVAVVGELLGELEADAAGGAGDDGEGLGGHPPGLPDGSRRRTAYS
jgi:hypothetical protein